MGSVQPPPPPARRFPMWREGLAAPAHLNLNLITSAAAQRLGTIAHRQFRGFILRSSMSSSMGLSQFSCVPGLKNAWLESAKPLNGVDFFASSYISFSARCSSCLFFFSKKDTVENVDDDKNLYIKTPNKKPFNGRLWTNVLLVINVLMYVAQIASQGKLILMGAKINSLIDQGELWRLATSTFLHANVGHLMVNCYSLDSIGPTMENISGPRRFLAIYFTSAIASSVTSYWFCKAPAVGASGAIFGLVGSYAVFMLRHRYIFGGAKQDLQHIAQVISLNMVIGILSKGIDNWGHLGGLLGGVAISWFVGPAWKYEPRSKDGILAFADKAPIFYLRKAK